MPFPLLAAAPIIGAGITGLSQAITNNQNIQSQNNYNEDMKNWNEKMWNMNNAYNTPLAQRKRMTEAGLSPQLMYGQGTPGNSSSPVSAPQGAKAPQSQELLQGANIGLLYAQAKNLEADTANKLATNPLLKEKTNTQKSYTALTDAKVFTEDARKASLLLSNTYNFKTMDDRVAVQKAIEKIQSSTAKFSDQRIQTQIDLMKSQIDQNISSKNLNEVRKTIDEYEAKFRAMGLSFRDELQYRLLAKGLNELVNLLK